MVARPLAAQPPGPADAQPSALHRATLSAGANPASAGFAPAEATLLFPLLQLAPPGPERAARSIALFDGQIDLYRQILFHPMFSSALARVVGQMPPRQATLLRAASLYARDDIPWQRSPNGVHRINVLGEPWLNQYLYSLVPSGPALIKPNHFRGMFALRPTGNPADPAPASVIGELGGSVRVSSYGLAGLIDVAGAAIGRCYGDLHPPWDGTAGHFNQHDRAAIVRLRRDLPSFAAQLHHYFHVTNVVDEFGGGGRSPIVLFNLDAEVRADSLKPFPHLYRFYSRIAPHVNAQTIIDDGSGGRWALFSFERGRIRIVFLDVAGELLPFDRKFAPAGSPVAIGAVSHGHYHTSVSLHYTKLGMTFGIDNLVFATDYDRDANGVRFVTHMTGVPQIVAPPVIRQAVAFIANRFLTAMAEGHGGMNITLASHHLAGGGAMVDARWSAELHYSPGLGILARVADAIADAHNRAVRADERRLAEELFDAFIRDYNAQKPRILALDGSTGAIR